MNACAAAPVLVTNLRGVPNSLRNYSANITDDERPSPAASRLTLCDHKPDELLRFDDYFVDGPARPLASIREICFVASLSHTSQVAG
jgi:hypothetical protein